MIELGYNPTRKLKIKNCSFKRNTLYFRWMFLLVIIPIFYLISDKVINYSSFSKVIGIVGIYNALVTIYIIKKHKIARTFPNFVFYVDIIIIAVLSNLIGGVNSDVFIIFFFIISFYGMRNDISRTVNISIFNIITYAIISTVFYITGFQEVDFGKLFLRCLFIILAAYGISLVIVEVKKYDKMHKKEFILARTDKLTGLPNRHYLEQKLKEDLFKDEETVLNILIFDLDNFKGFNDTYGHNWGDKLLTIFADIINYNIRKEDIPVRYGGEEFLLIVKNADLDVAKRVGDRVRRHLEKQKIQACGEEDKIVTVSCGVAQYPTHGNDFTEVVGLADKALYFAKENGKNIVIGYDEILEFEDKAVNE